MANNTTEKPVEPVAAVEENKVEKEPATEPESTTTEEVEKEENGNGHVEETNGHTEDSNGDAAEEETNGDAEEKDDATLKRKDAPVDTDESVKKKKLIEADEEKEAEPVAVVET